MPVLARNKKAFHDYFIEDKLEAGIELVGTEVKSVKAGKVSIKESFIRIIKDEIFILFKYFLQTLPTILFKITLSSNNFFTKSVLNIK